MQKLTYQNLRGERAVFGCAPPYILCKVRGLGMSDMDIESARGQRPAGRKRAGRQAADARREPDVAPVGGKPGGYVPPAGGAVRYPVAGQGV